MTAETQIPEPTKNSRLHLYLASACPFCHRVYATLAITGLADQVGCSWVLNIKGTQGWEVDPKDPASFGKTYLSELYAHFNPDNTYRHSVPLLVDLADNTILSTNSSDITRFLSKGMNGTHKVAVKLCPDELEEEINALNEELHDTLNRAVYLVGFTTKQAEYEQRVADIFKTLDKLDQRLSRQPYLLGKVLTESDLYLLATLVRFDSVYYFLFKCCYRFINDYQALSSYLENLLKLPNIADTVERERYKEHYFKSVMHVGGEPISFNPTKIIPVEYQAR